jgi:hypothetical protein
MHHPTTHGGLPGAPGDADAVLEYLEPSGLSSFTPYGAEANLLSFKRWNVPARFL